MWVKWVHFKLRVQSGEFRTKGIFDNKDSLFRLTGIILFVKAREASETTTIHYPFSTLH